ncbi:DUF2975 domain-containing protein [Methylocystis sp. B8]|uniref:DUF2975 domain-containing protein n=1 Tax=Methylocystis sp. B8 TaxID=544938 RepID=UPI0010FE6E34|nr:DUF2975 domain-containing protein [Methylocystis sp. B8]TLG79280.1 DUF2975 domain-containing protein [Methylocystis sp. B8]
MTDCHHSVLSLDDRRLDSLRGRIGWLCQALRFALVVYCLWILFTIVRFWNDEAQIISRFASLKVDVEGMSVYQRLAAFGLSFAIWALLVVACYAGWRLFSGYLEGRIFTPDASGWLRSLALMGLSAALVDIAARPVMSLILTAHKAAGAHMVSVYLRPEDLSTLMLLATLLALAHVQKTAADIADEHSQIV